MTGSTAEATATVTATLCRIIADLLELDLVHPQDRFFEIGGDSVLALQVVARAREAGLAFNVRDLFDNQSPQALAAVTGRATAPVTEDVAEPPLLTFTADELDDFEDIETGEQAGDTEAGWE